MPLNSQADKLLEMHGDTRLHLHGSAIDDAAAARRQIGVRPLAEAGTTPAKPRPRAHPAGPNDRNLPLPGSTPVPAARAEPLGPVHPDEPIEVTVVLRRRAELPESLVDGPDTVSVEELASRYGADPADVDRARAVFEAAGLTVDEVDAGSRRMSVSGSAASLSALFGTELGRTRSTDRRGRRVEHRSREGGLHVPAALGDVVTAVLGLDNPPVGSLPRAQALTAQAVDTDQQAVAYDPPFLATDVYGFPAGTDGRGQIAAIIEFAGGYTPSDLETYFKSLNVATPAMRDVGVGGARNQPGRDLVADGEVELDIEILGAMAPGAQILVYFGQNDERGWVDALSTAIHATPTPTVISISWAAPENAVTAQAGTALEAVFADAAALGATVCGPAGDNGSADGETDGAAHVNYPASSPHVLAVGGTSLRLSAVGAKGTETVWNDGAGSGATGGGVSAIFPLPAWQSHVEVPTGSDGATRGRGVPDVAALADPLTGYSTLIAGKARSMGGTSAAVPLWAALVCRLSEALGRKLGLLQPAIYASATPGTATPGFRDITTGSNGAYQAAPGWDACTGLGVPDGAALLNVLKKHG
jgi:kumamolisin